MPYAMTPAGVLGKSALPLVSAGQNFAFIVNNRGGREVRRRKARKKKRKEKEDIRVQGLLMVGERLPDESHPRSAFGLSNPSLHSPAELPPAVAPAHFFVLTEGLLTFTSAQTTAVQVIVGGSRVRVPSLQ